MTYAPVSRFDPTWVNALCSVGPRPLVMTGWLRLWLTSHFADLALLEDPKVDAKSPLVDMIWDPALSSSGILIDSITRWNPDETEQRPALVIKRNRWSRVRLGIDDRLLGESNGLTGYSHHANLWIGNHTIFAVARNGPETEKLGAEVYRELNQFAPVFRQVLNLHRFEVTEVGELYIIDESRQSFAVPIVVSYAFLESWQVRQEVPVFTHLDLSLMQP